MRYTAPKLRFKPSPLSKYQLIRQNAIKIGFKTRPLSEYMEMRQTVIKIEFKPTHYQNICNWDKQQLKLDSN